MMLPSASPMLMLYAGAMRTRDEPSVMGGVYALAAGYIVVWAAFSVIATALQRVLAAQLLLSPMMEATSPLMSGGLLIVAGAYQLTPLKRACLQSCRSPFAFLATRWRRGVAGAFRMGLEHGLDCLGCCWALMLLLFAGGVMNLWVIAVLMGVVLVEKFLPAGAQGARLLGLLLLGAGCWIAIRA
jgi:predicted metal-binding membrane protein